MANLHGNTRGYQLRSSRYLPHLVFTSICLNLVLLAYTYSLTHEHDVPAALIGNLQLRRQHPGHLTSGALRSLASAGSLPVAASSAPITVSVPLAAAASLTASASASAAAPQTFVDPATARRVAWAIPVNGWMQRAHMVRDTLAFLVRSGAGAENVYVFDDNTSRKATRRSLGYPGGIPEDGTNTVQYVAIKEAAAALGVRLIPSNVPRAADEPKGNFGLFLARHYKFMYDTLMTARGAAAAGIAGNGDVGDAGDVKGGAARGGAPYDYVVMIEDDLRLAPDAVNYFHAAAGAMDVDPTLGCASAWTNYGMLATTTELPPHGNGAGNGAGNDAGNAAGIAAVSSSKSNSNSNRGNGDGGSRVDPLDFHFRRGSAYVR